jgi:hypothetical protein
MLCVAYKPFVPSIVMLSVVMLSVIMLNVVMLSVVAPYMPSSPSTKELDGTFLFFIVCFKQLVLWGL